VIVARGIRIPSLRREDFKIDRKHCSSGLKGGGEANAACQKSWTERQV